MDAWEYHVKIVQTDTTQPGMKGWVQQQYQGMQKPPQYTPYLLLPALNELGEHGWELVYMEPVVVNGAGEVALATTQVTHAYLCVFKRRRPTP